MACPDDCSLYESLLDDLRLKLQDEVMRVNLAANHSIVTKAGETLNNYLFI
jgi:hypothetical protein